eukprot:CAMPEP_0172925032 /NCGR_PEP_ID=MMETSP1075-20121228/212910_1 /TAXON_ID=2916 /ORGANISM="Ceratium fusus, Strain PA161109" /LENGTH=228 /DNA_ID=CAMNT_0013785821 /DNA_START=125 /DNA_END=808 /DNA_ORIENTATION=+
MERLRDPGKRPVAWKAVRITTAVKELAAGGEVQLLRDMLEDLGGKIIRVQEEMNALADLLTDNLLGGEAAKIMGACKEKVAEWTHASEVISRELEAVSASQRIDSQEAGVEKQASREPLKDNLATLSAERVEIHAVAQETQPLKAKKKSKKQKVTKPKIPFFTSFFGSIKKRDKAADIKLETRWLHVSASLQKWKDAEDEKKEDEKGLTVPANLQKLKEAEDEKKEDE